jgi:transposase InsO family protein
LWYRRIQGELSNLGHKLARSTIANILERHGIGPAPERSRKTTWKEFLTQHWDLFVAVDFFTVEVWTAKGLRRFIVLFSIELSTRRVEIAGISAAAHGLWMSQIARNVTDAVEGLLTGQRYLIHDRDPLFTDAFLSSLKDAGVESVKLPPRSPNLNAHGERFVRSIKESCLGTVDPVWREFVAHSGSELRDALPRRAQPPGPRQPPDSTGSAPPRKQWTDQVWATSRGNAQILLSNSSLKYRRNHSDSNG